MKDIANELGLSIVTISKVLRDHPDISPETRERVLKHVKARDYHPNTLARSLVTGRSYLIGLVVPDLLHPFFAEIAKSLSLAIRAQGYSLLISSSEEDPKLEEQEIGQLLARNIDAVVVASTASSGERFATMRNNKTPVLLVDRNFGNPDETFVGVDDRASGRLATEHLIQVGCRRIAHIGGRSNSTGLQRLEGYRDALASLGIPFSPSMVVHRNNADTESTEQGADAARQLLSRKHRPDGIFCYNDPLAIGAMQVILNAGLRIPQDIALIGCGNLHYDDMIGKSAGAIVLDMIQKKGERIAEAVVLTPSLKVRASSNRHGQL